MVSAREQMMSPNKEQEKQLKGSTSKCREREPPIPRRVRQASVGSMVRRSWIPDHPNLPVHLQKLTNQPPLATTVNTPTQKNKQSAMLRNKAMRAPLTMLPTPKLSMPAERYPECPEDWLELTDENQQDYLLPRHAANVPSNWTTFHLTGEE